MNQTTSSRLKDSPSCIRRTILLAFWGTTHMRTFIRAFEIEANADGRAAFDPETVGILIAAFDDAWQSVKANEIDLSSENRIELVRTVLARRILELALTGERDPDRLRKEAMLDLAKSIRPTIPPQSK